MELINRVKDIINDLGISEREFASSIGIGQRSINYYLKGQQKPGLDLIVKIADTYPDISMNWLITGDGDMRGKSILLPSQLKPLPLYDVDAAAGYESFDVMISKEKVAGEFVIPTFASADWMIHVRGASMYPKYSSGDIIACKAIKESRFIQWNKVYVVATREQGLLVKRLMPSEKAGHIKAVSDNERYPPFDIPEDEIFGIALVLGAVKLE